jgi:predicted transcriptional regulator
MVLPASPVLQPSTADGTIDSQVLSFDLRGDSIQLTSVHSTYEVRHEGLPTQVPPATGSALQPRSSIAGIVPLPSLPAAAGLSVLSLVVAAAYYLWPVAKAGGVGLFSRVTEDELLDNPVRRRLAALIEAQPGIHYQALVRGSGAGQGATDHHLRKLVDARLVSKRVGTGFTCYFPAVFDPALAAAAPALKSEGARRILDAIHGAPGASAKEVAAATGLDAATVTHHVQRLQAAGLVEAHRVGRSLSLKATSLGQAAS